MEVSIDLLIYIQYTNSCVFFSPGVTTTKAVPLQAIVCAVCMCACVRVFMVVCVL